jgi:hypothetical protein
MDIDVRHVPLEEESVLDRLLAPVVIPDSLKGFPNLASKTQVPVVPMIPEADVLDGIPEILTESGVPEKAPVLVRR